MPDHRRVRERPRLLVDLSEKVSEDLRISIPTTTPTLKAGPSLKAGPRANGVRPNTASLAGAGLLAARTHDVRAARRVTPRISPALRERIKTKVRSVIPGDGEVVFTLIYHEWFHAAGRPWVNEMECNFWLGADRHLDQAIDEWMGSEYEHICDVFYEHSVDFTWGDPREGLELDPSEEILVEAWEAVCLDNPATHLKVPVRDGRGYVVSEEVVTAQDLMDYFGLDRDAIKPVVVLAGRLLEEDLRAIENDEEVLLNGYLIHAIDKGEFDTIHLIPPQ